MDKSDKTSWYNFCINLLFDFYLFQPLVIVKRKVILNILNIFKIFEIILKE